MTPSYKLDLALINLQDALRLAKTKKEEEHIEKEIEWTKRRIHSNEW